MSDYLNKQLTLPLLCELLQHIQKHNQVGATGKWVKYVHPLIDMRTGMCYAVRFIEWCGEETLIHTQNECAQLEAPLYSRCIEWLAVGE